MDQVGKTVYRANGGHAYEKEKYLLFSKFFLIMPVQYCMNQEGYETFQNTVNKNFKLF